METDEYFISLFFFFFCFKLILRQSLLSIRAASVTKYYFRRSYTQFFVGMDKESRALRESGWIGLYDPLSTITAKTTV